MKILYSILFWLLITNTGIAQKFPDAFVGNWKGEISWFAQGAKEPKKFAMQLRVQPADTAGQFTWQIIYGKEEKDNRPYLLKAVDTAKGHWVIDERNGIVLDQYWLGNKLQGAFTVAGSTIVNSYWIENGRLMVEFVSYPAKPLARTGSGTEDSPYVDSYAIKSFQKGILSKAKTVQAVPLRKQK
jgi:hypothetical protein